MGTSLYNSFWIIFIILIILFFFTKFLFNFFKLNGIKYLLIIFDKQHRLFLILLLSFIVIFWGAFLGIFYLRYYPSLYFDEYATNIETGIGNNGIDSCKVGYDCKNIINLNITSSENITLEITDYGRNHIKFKLNKNIILTACTNCKITTLKANQEYKLSLNEIINFDILNKDNKMKYSYSVYLRR